MSQQNNMPAAVVNMFSVMNGWLYADPVEGSQKRPTLRVGVFGNQPRLTVRTNVQGDQNHGKIDFNCDLATFAAAINFVKKLVDGTAETDHLEFVYQNDFVAGKKLDNIIPLASLVVGKDAEGKIYIAIISTQEGRPRIKFYFGPSKFHTVRMKDKSTADAGMMSRIYAHGWAQPAYDLVIHYLTADFNPDAKGVANPNNMQGGQGGGQRQGGGGYGGGQRQGGGGGYGGGQQRQGGYNGGGGAPAPRQQAPLFDEDIPDF